MVFILAAGCAQPLQAVLNSQLARLAGASVWAACISAAVSSATLAIVAMTVFHIMPPSPRQVMGAPFLVIAGGLIGALVLGAMTTVTPRLGAVVTFLCFIAGITVCSVLLDQFGVLGLPQQSLSLPRAVGIVFVVMGVAIVRLS